MVPLNTPLKNGQTVEIITAKGGAPAAAGPSRDWLNPGYAVEPAHARQGARLVQCDRASRRRWRTAARWSKRSLQREGKTAVNLEELAHKLGFRRSTICSSRSARTNSACATSSRRCTPTGAKARAGQPTTPRSSTRAARPAWTQGAKSGVLVVGTEGLMTQLAQCCKPAPPDAIVGFVTRGKGVSIHRANCKNLRARCAARRRSA